MLYVQGNHDTPHHMAKYFIEILKKSLPWHRISHSQS